MGGSFHHTTGTGSGSAPGRLNHVAHLGFLGQLGGRRKRGKLIHGRRLSDFVEDVEGKP